MLLRPTLSTGQGGAGLHASVIPWLRERDVALLVSDVQSSGVAGINRPVHQLTQVNLGLPLVDNAFLEDAAEVAERLRRWEFMFTLHIMQLRGATAAPFSALGTFGEFRSSDRSRALQQPRE